MITRRGDAAAHSRQPDESVFESTDPELTEAYLTAAITTTKVKGDGDHYRFRHARLGRGPFHVDTVDHMGTTEYRAEPLSALAVIRVHRGVRTNMDVDERLGPGDLSLHAQPGEPYYTRLASTLYTGVSFPVVAAAEAAHNRPDDDLGPLRFASLRPANPAGARRWLQAVEYVSANLQTFPEAMAGPLLSGAATRLLAATLLTTFPNTWVTEPHHQDRTDATPTTLTRAIDFIETNADLDISMVDIARAAFVTVRAVQLAFRRHLDTTPMVYLRQIRLERAHEQLGVTNPDDGTTIGQIAARWGFADPSRFTALYRRTYDELPSHTLRS